MNNVTRQREARVRLTLLAFLALAPPSVWGGSETAPAAGFTRTEQDDPSVAYSGGTWYPNQSASDSGGSAVLSEDKGARATFTFTGSTVQWIGYSDSWSGIANIYVDGVLQGQVDAYSASSVPQALLYSIGGLSPAGHTLSIEVSGQANPAAQGNWVWVDAFDVDPHFQETAPGVSLTGSTWYFGSGTEFSGGGAAEAYQAGTVASLSFTGTGVTWIGYSDPDTGIADVSVDGGPVTEIDTYAPGENPQVPLYAVDGLSPGPHNLSIATTGRYNPAAAEAWIVVDAFLVRGNVLDPDTTPPTVSLTSPANGWSVAGSVALSADASDNVSVVGVQFLLDGAPLGAEQTRAPYFVSWDTRGAAAGSHTLAASAHDVAGNVTATPAITVTLGASATRVEQTDPSVAYTGAWITTSDPNVSGGTFTESNSPGATATLSFTGSGVSWISYRCSCEAGIANIYLDGTYVGQVDTNAANPVAQAAVYTVANLPEGAHTLTVSVTGQYDRNGGTSAYVAVDAFDVIP